MSYLYAFFVLVLWLFFIVFTSIYMILRILTLLYFVPVASYTWFRPLISVGWYIFTVYFFLFSASGFSFSLFTLLFFSFYFFRSAFFFLLSFFALSGRCGAVRSTSWIHYSTRGVSRLIYGEIEIPWKPFRILWYFTAIFWYASLCSVNFIHSMCYFYYLLDFRVPCFSTSS